MSPAGTDFEVLPVLPHQGGGSNVWDDDGRRKMGHSGTAFEVSLDLPQQGGGSNGLDDGGRLEPSTCELHLYYLTLFYFTWRFHGTKPCAMWTATACMIADVIRPEVLSLPWAVAQLGWIVGPATMFCLAFVTYFTSTLLAACYRSGNPIIGERNCPYMDAVRSNLGGTKAKVCGLVQYLNIFGVAIGCTVAFSASMTAIDGLNCFHKKNNNSLCHKNSNSYIIVFGVMEIILSQIPNLDHWWWLRIMVTVMSFTYATIGLALSIAKVSENDKFKGSLTGISSDAVSQTQKIWRIFQALGNIAFAYSYSIEIQDTSKSLPSAAKTMKNARLVCVADTTIFYMLYGCMGYAAFGEMVPGNLLAGFGFFGPYWLVDIANVNIAIHLVSAYQVYSRLLFGFIEEYAKKRYEHSQFITKEIKIPVLGFQPYKLKVLKLILRTIFVILTTGISMLPPFFDGVVGLLGALGFWPLTVYFPVEMYIAQTKIPRWSTKWLCLQMLSVACLIITIAAAAGSFAGAVFDLKSYKPFRTRY